jgi:hypothetical protein
MTSLLLSLFSTFLLINFIFFLEAALEGDHHVPAEL